ncbi:hypothetical protein [Gordonia sp. NB41Y]|nr:hypothetical protein [Gordonia sp. NB41Y]WLP92777.1 hypothetical protein Q9K23_11415 [Gordonia sp. NB41Y]
MVSPAVPHLRSAGRARPVPPRYDVRTSCIGIGLSIAALLALLLALILI